VILIKYLYIGIDDTDSPDGMCTTYLASQIINEFANNGIELVDYPRLIRLNPFARHKTRGNGGVALKILNDSKADLAKQIVLDKVEKLSMFDCDNTNPGVIFYDGEITPEMEDYAFRAIYEFITIDEAEEFGKSVGCEIHKFKKGRGIIGSIAAIGLPLSDCTYELLAYRAPENFGTPRQIDYDSVYEMDERMTDLINFKDDSYLCCFPSLKKIFFVTFDNEFIFKDSRSFDDSSSIGEIYLINNKLFII
jgi:tRNA(Ile2)-agmatinylcytidine synthase